MSEEQLTEDEIKQLVLDALQPGERGEEAMHRYLDLIGDYAIPGRGRAWRSRILQFYLGLESRFRGLVYRLLG